MATTRSFLLIPVTLCFLVVLAAAAAEQGKATATLLVIQGKALCKSNTSRIISNDQVQLVINNTTVPGGTGRTTSDGHILVSVNMNCTEQLAALMSNGSSKAFIVAPPHACGAPRLPAGTVVAAKVQPITMMTISGGGSSSLHRPTIADATGNKGDVLRLVVAKVEKFACVALTGIIGRISNVA